MLPVSVLHRLRDATSVDVIADNPIRHSVSFTERAPVVRRRISSKKRREMSSSSSLATTPLSAAPLHLVSMQPSQKRTKSGWGEAAVLGEDQNVRNHVVTQDDLRNLFHESNPANNGNEMDVSLTPTTREDEHSDSEDSFVDESTARRWMSGAMNHSPPTVKKPFNRWDNSSCVSSTSLKDTVMMSANQSLLAWKSSEFEHQPRSALTCAVRGLDKTEGPVLTKRLALLAPPRKPVRSLYDSSSSLSPSDTADLLDQALRITGVDELDDTASSQATPPRLPQRRLNAPLSSLPTRF